MTGTAQNIQISALASFGLLDFSHTTLLNYQEPSSSTATIQGTTTENIPATTSNNLINLSTLFPAAATPVALMIIDTTPSPGVALALGLVSSGTRFFLAGGGFILMRLGAGALPNIYIDNSSSTIATIQISILSN